MPESATFDTVQFDTLQFLVPRAILMPSVTTKASTSAACPPRTTRLTTGASSAEFPTRLTAVGTVTVSS